MNILRRLHRALFDPQNHIVIIPLIWIFMAAQIAHAAGLIQMRFDFACAAMSFAYLFSAGLSFVRDVDTA